MAAAVLLAGAALAGPTETDPLANRASHEGQIMNNPQHRQIVSILALPEMQPELGLSAQQVTTLRRLKEDLLAKTKDLAGQINYRQRELDSLLSGDTSRTRTVKALYDKIGELQADMQYAAFDTTVKMKAALNAQQRSRFEAMKPMEVHHLMMTRGNTADMETLMRRMGMEEMRTQSMGAGGTGSGGMNMGGANTGMMRGGVDVVHDDASHDHDTHHH